MPSSVSEDAVKIAGAALQAPPVWRFPREQNAISSLATSNASHAGSLPHPLLLLLKFMFPQYLTIENILQIKHND